MLAHAMLVIASATAKRADAAGFRLHAAGDLGGEQGGEGEGLGYEHDGDGGAGGGGEGHGDLLLFQVGAQRETPPLLHAGHGDVRAPDRGAAPDGEAVARPDHALLPL